MSQIIPPTPGRIVHYHPLPHEGMHQLAGADGHPQPLAAMVTAAWNDRMVNLVVWDANGVAHLRPSVALVQPDATAPQGLSYCAWMPYQVGQVGQALAIARAAADSIRYGSAS